jgi:hypothetical protein
MRVLAIVLALPVVAWADRISPDWVPKWRADLAFAADSLPRAHPNFFHAVTRETYRAALDFLSARVPDLDHHQIVVELARILALVHDGHTRLSFPFDSAAGFFSGHSKTAAPKVPGLVFRHYPVRFGLFADTLFVVRADSTHRELLGGRVVSLGTMTAAEAMAAVEPTVQRDNEAQVRDLLPTWLVCPEILHARGVNANMEHAPIVVERDGVQVSGSLTPVPPATSIHWIEARDPGPPPLRERYSGRSHWFTALPGTHTIYARYREVLDDPKESVAEFADSLFAAIERSHADRLVLDLRGNVGGDGSRNRPLVQHLIRAQRLWRPGGLWALIDRGTFSAAVMLAADLEMRTPTLLVGEMTGGHPNSYGDSRRVVLPNSGITVRVSSLYWQLTGPQDPREGITPHVPVTLRFSDWRANRDPALEAALARGGKATRLAGSWSGEIGFQSARLPLRLDLVQKGAKWEGRVNLPDAELTDAPLAEVRAVGEGIAARWMTGDEAWTLSARPAGERVVGLVHCHGLDFPVVLQRSQAE